MRSLLFAPGDDERKLLRALESDADGVIADLEDAVAPGNKQHARELVAAVFAQPDPRSGPVRLVRVNSPPELYELDAQALEAAHFDVVVVPKATPELVERHGGRPSIPILETAAGLRSTYETARCEGVRALMLGSFDLSLELRLLPRPDGLELLCASWQLVVDSAAAGIAGPIDGVHVAIDDVEGLAARASFARSIGFGGKACIHPAQVAVVNEVFQPTSAEIEQAQAILEEFDRAVAAGTGVVRLDGQMIDLPVAERARQLLAEESRD